MKAKFVFEGLNILHGQSTDDMAEKMSNTIRKYAIPFDQFIKEFQPEEQEGLKEVEKQLNSPELVFLPAPPLPDTPLPNYWRLIKTVGKHVPEELYNLSNEMFDIYGHGELLKHSFKVPNEYLELYVSPEQGVASFDVEDSGEYYGWIIDPNEVKIEFNYGRKL